MATSIALVLTRTIQAAGVPILGVSIGDDADRSTWRVDYHPDVTTEQLALGASVVEGFDPTMALNTHRLISTMENDSGQSAEIAGPNGEKLSAVDPSVEHILIPEPRLGYVMVPIWAGIQCDSNRDLVVWHGLLNPIKHVVPTDTSTDPVFNAADTPGLEISWQNQQNNRNALILGTVKLQKDALVGGEFFISVPVFPIPRGFNILSSWSYATPSSAIRSRSWCVEVPAETFDWNRAQTPAGPFPRLTTA